MFPVVMGREVPKEKIDAALKDLNQSLNLLEEKFLQNKPFITGDKISVADLVAIVEIMQVIVLSFTLLQLVSKCPFFVCSSFQDHSYLGYSCYYF